MSAGEVKKREISDYAASESHSFPAPAPKTTKDWIYSAGGGATNGKLRPELITSNNSVQWLLLTRFETLQLSIW